MEFFDLFRFICCFGPPRCFLEKRMKHTGSAFGLECMNGTLNGIYPDQSNKRSAVSAAGGCGEERHKQCNTLQYITFNKGAAGVMRKKKEPRARLMSMMLVCRLLCISSRIFYTRSSGQGHRQGRQGGGASWYLQNSGRSRLSGDDGQDDRGDRCVPLCGGLLCTYVSLGLCVARLD